MIHKDLEPDNTVLHAGEVHAIDFADCGWGYYLYDVAASLLPLREKQGYPDLDKLKRAAFLYREQIPYLQILNPHFQPDVLVLSLRRNQENTPA